MSGEANVIRNIALAGKEDFEESMRRIYAWYEGEIIDRAPVRFWMHNASFNQPAEERISSEEWKRRWFDAEAVVERFARSIEGKRFLGETFPIFLPNLGPDVYAAFYGGELTYGDVTSWSQPIVKRWEDVAKLKLDMNNSYMRKIDEITDIALARCEGKFLVAYTDLHPGIDCALAWRGMEQLCYDMMDEPEMVRELAMLASQDFGKILGHFDEKLKWQGQPSINWLEIPSFGKVHVPSADFATMMSPKQFEAFALPAIELEVRGCDHNVFHVDGKGVAHHIDRLLEIPEIQAYQWVQGVAEDEDIMQWVPLIKRIQGRGKAVIVNLKKEELEDFISEVRPEGVFLWVGVYDEEEQRKVIERVARW